MDRDRDRVAVRAVRSGRDPDILWPFQITYVGALVFGLTHLLLADHDGPFDRRDWLGLAAGAAGLMCSGVAIAMVVAVGVATLIRRGVRIAAVHTVPLGVAYVIWLSTMAGDTFATAGPARRTSSGSCSRPPSTCCEQ